MHRHARDVVAAHLDFTRVNAHADLDAERADGVDDRVGTIDCDAGAGEHGDESIADRVDFATAKSFELVADYAVMVVKQGVPPVVTERGRAFG